MRNTILVGDIHDHVQEIGDHAIDCIVTSPPYHRLRDYGHPDQMGHEATIDGWVQELCIVAKEWARVLRPDGTLWLNVGDGYSDHHREGAPKKSLLLGPQRLAIALAEDGWIVRNQLIWHKPNGLPSSVRDRLSTQYEVVLLLARSDRYFFDLDTIRIPATSHRRQQRKTPRRRGARPPTYPAPAQRPAARQTGDSDRGLAAMKRRGLTSHPLGKSPGDVWSIPTARYTGNHDATFPVELAERCILAGTPERVCTQCRTPWLRAQHLVGGRLLRTGALEAQCDCGRGWQPGIVLDPFMGAGTTAIAAERHRRDWLGVELNPDYAHQARARIAGERKSSSTTTEYPKET